MSRDFNRLSPIMREVHGVFMQRCLAEGLDVVTICTDRSDAEQAELYAYGRTKPGVKRTGSRPGESAHNAKNKDGEPASEAFDIGIIQHGRYIGDGKHPHYLRAGAIGEELGLVWAGRWAGLIKESAHFENSNWKKP